MPCTTLKPILQTTLTAKNTPISHILTTDRKKQDYLWLSHYIASGWDISVSKGTFSNLWSWCDRNSRMGRSRDLNHFDKEDIVMVTTSGSEHHQILMFIPSVKWLLPTTIIQTTIDLNYHHLSKYCVVSLFSTKTALTWGLDSTKPLKVCCGTWTKTSAEDLSCPGNTEVDWIYLFTTFHKWSTDLRLRCPSLSIFGQN